MSTAIQKLTDSEVEYPGNELSEALDSAEEAAKMCAGLVPRTAEISHNSRTGRLLPGLLERARQAHSLLSQVAEILDHDAHSQHDAHATSQPAAAAPETLAHS